MPMATILYKWFLVSGLFFMAGFSKPGATVLHKTVPVSAEAFHPFYISITEINHNAKDKTLEISCKMFAEDLEETLNKNYKTKKLYETLFSFPYKTVPECLLFFYLKWNRIKINFPACLQLVRSWIDLSGLFR